MIELGNSRRLATACTVLLYLAVVVPAAGQPVPQPAQPQFPLVSTAKCFECHFTPPQPGVPDVFRTSEDFCRREEAHVWQDRDKHRQSLYLLLKPDHLPLTEQILGFKVADVLTYELVDSAAAGPAGELVRGVAFRMDAKPADVAVVRQCLACHAPVEERVEGGVTRTTVEYGVSCQACHGPGRGYELPHQKPGWRLVKAEVKEQKFGLRDLRSPWRRAELCSSCHVGDRSQNPPRFVRHEWYAKGHPPLPSLEPVTFVAQEPAHWRPLQEKLYRPGGFRYLASRPEGAELADMLRFDFFSAVSEAELGAGYLAANRGSFSSAPEKDMARTKDVLTGGLATLGAYAGIIADQPEQAPLDFALFDCQACHHELRSQFPSQARVRRSGAVGRPPAAFWPVALARLGSERAGKSQPQVATEFAESLASLERAFAARAFGDREAMIVAAVKLRAACRSLGQTLATEPLDEGAAREILLTLVQPQRDEDRDYHAARQTAWGVREVLKDLTGVPVRNYAIAAPGDPRPPVKNLPPPLVKLLGGAQGAVVAADHEQVRLRIDKLFDGGQPSDALWHAPLRLRLPAGQQETIVGQLPESLTAISLYDPEQFRQRLAAIRAALAESQAP